MYYEILGIDVKLDEETSKLGGSASGYAAPMIEPLFKGYLDMLNAKGKVIARRRGGNVYSLYQPPQPSPAGVRVMLHRFQRTVLGKVIPSTATMSVTYACQCRCRHCSAVHFMRDGKKQGKRELTTEEFKRAMDQAVELGCVNIALSGGEPLLRKDILELINHVDPDKANVMLFTNGILLNDEMVKKLAESNLFSLMISIDSSKPEEHDYYRRYEGLFEIAMEGARRALDAGLLVGFSTYITREALEAGELQKRIELAHEIGVHELTIFDPVPTGMFLDREDMILTKEEKDRIIAICEEYEKRYFLPKLSPQALINGPRGAGCFAGYHQFYMTAHGDICPCDFTPLTFGNVLEEPLDTIWKRMTSHPAYCKRERRCRMQNPEFRKRYIHTIPKDAPKPYRLDLSKIGVLAGFGDFPMIFVREVQKLGYQVHLVAIEEEISCGIGKYVKRFGSVGVGELQRMIDMFKNEGISDVVMIGKVHKNKLYDDNIKVDERMRRLLESLPSKDDATLLHAIGHEMEKEGLRIREPHAYLSRLLVEEGVLTERQPSAKEWADVRYGFGVAKQIAALGIGQTVVVKDGAVLAVEAIEGTDKTITRAAALTNGGAVVVKVTAPEHDMRYDTPVIGPDTVNAMFMAGAKVLAVEAGRTIVLDKESVVEKANDRDITIVGFKY